MPILKLSNNIKKYALEAIRVPISPIGDCPQCQGNAYRDGICTDCAYIDPRVQEAIQEWQDAMGIQQVVKQQQQQNPNDKGNKKAAYRSLSFVDVLPSQEISQMYSTTPASTGKVKCPACKQMTFENESLTKDQISGECSNRECLHEIAGPLGFKRGPKVKKDIGPRPEWLKGVGGVQRNFPRSRAAQEIEKNKKTLKKSGAKGMNPGAVLDNSMVVVTDDIPRSEQLLRQKALIDASGNQTDNEDNNEEQK